MSVQGSSVKELFDSVDWIFEAKLDGYRAIAVIDSGGKARLFPAKNRRREMAEGAMIVGITCTNSRTRGSRSGSQNRLLIYTSTFNGTGKKILAYGVRRFSAIEPGSRPSVAEHIISVSFA